MNLVKLDTCPACGAANNETARACNWHCTRKSATDFIDDSTFSHTSEVHLHVKCRTCQVEWLEAVNNEQEMERAW